MINPIVQLDFQHPVSINDPDRIVQNLVPSNPQQCELIGNAEVINTGNKVRDKRIQKGLSLPATGSRLILRDIGALNRVLNAMTIEFNIEPTNVQEGGTQRLASRWDAGQLAFTINLKNEKIIFNISPDGTNKYKVESTATIKNNEMTHVACTLVNGVMSIWINKKLDAELDLGGTVNVAVSTSPLVLGGNADDDAHQFWGTIADFRLWDVNRKVFGRIYHVVIPSIVAVGEPFTVKLFRLSQKGQPIQHISEHVRIINTEDFTGLPTDAFDMLDVHQIENVSTTIEGVHRIQFQIVGDNVMFESNPILVKPTVDRRFYWGDLHCHSNLEQGNNPADNHAQGSPDEVYFHAEHYAHLDVFALSGHGFRYRDQIGDWQTLINHANIHYKPGEFVTVLAQEWAGRSGGGVRYWENGDDHHIIYYFGQGEEAFISGQNVPDQFYPGRGHISGTEQLDYTVCDTIDELAPLLEPYGGVVIPHHMRSGAHYRGSPTPAHETAMPVVEIYSRWGSSESQGCKRPTNAWLETMREGYPSRLAFDLLNDGYKIGFIGCSDSHSGLPGTPHYGGYNMHYKSSGLTAFYCDDLTRFDVMDAMQERRTVATSGDRIILECWAEYESKRYEIGEKIPAAVNDTLDFYVEAVGVTEFELDFIVNGNVIDTFKSQGRHVINGKDYVVNAAAWIMWRVRQVNEETAWASPFFVEVA